MFGVGIFIFCLEDIDVIENFFDGRLVGGEVVFMVMWKLVVDLFFGFDFLKLFLLLLELWCFNVVGIVVIGGFVVVCCWFLVDVEFVVVVVFGVGCLVGFMFVGLVLDFLVLVLFDCSDLCRWGFWVGVDCC